MLLLTATAETQGQNPGDFCDAIEGELVVTFADCATSALAQTGRSGGRPTSTTGASLSSWTASAPPTGGGYRRAPS